MLSENKINRINELARKAKSEGLTKEEEFEQKQLRAEYIKSFRQSLDTTLHSVKVIDKHGNDVTPEKLQESKNRRNNTLFH